jgi:hypothetical protein
MIESRKFRYKFEKWWVSHEAFRYLVEQTWRAPVDGETVIDRLQNKVRRFMKRTKGWSGNVEAAIRKRKIWLAVEHEKLDVASEHRSLSTQERETLQQLGKELEAIWSMEEVKAR